MDIIKNRSPAPRRQTPKPNCTHIDMDRVFGRQCQFCLQYPAIGWVYVCRQDERNSDTTPMINSVPPDTESTSNSTLRAELKAIGLSDSIVETAERGDYTPDQLDTIKLQKTRFNQVISAAVHGRRRGAFSSTPSKRSVGLGIDPGAPRKDSGLSIQPPLLPPTRPGFENDPPNNDGAGASDLPLAQLNLNAGNDVPEPASVAVKSKTDANPLCSANACHHCRPYWKDRIYLSFGAVFADEVDPLTPEEAADLRVSSAEICRNIGLRRPQPRILTGEDGEALASSDSQYTIQTTQSETEDLRLMRQGPRNFYKLNSNPSKELRRDFRKFEWRNSLKYALNNLFKPSRKSSSQGSTITLPLARTGRHRVELTDDTDEFDLGSLKRVRSHRRMAFQAEQISQSTSGGLTSSTSSGCSEYSELSEGSEIEVDGGIALTEEAVGQGTPDIIIEEQIQQTQHVIKSAIDQIMTQA